VTKRDAMITLNMCGFCSLERLECGAQPILAGLLDLGLDPKDSVLACDKYISPVDILKERFHDPDL
jgi:hypothetical protein